MPTHRCETPDCNEYGHAGGDGALRCVKDHGGVMQAQMLVMYSVLAGLTAVHWEVRGNLPRTSQGGQ
jgi:hypothetical protein